MRTKKSERGQIIVILALAMVAILGITALAIDGSLIYNARRQDQNTADSAALAGAGAAANYLKDIQSGTLICGQATGTTVTGLIVNAVHASVAVDGIAAADMPKLANDTELAAADQGFTVTCNWYSNIGIQYLDVHVKVSTEMQTNFARIVNQDTLKTSVDSTARVYPRQPFAYGNGLVSLSDFCSKANNNKGGIYFEGGGTMGKKGTYLTNGGVFSNSCIEAPSGIVQVTGGSINYITTFVTNPDVSPPPEQASVKLPKNMFPEPVCPATMTTYSESKGVYVDPLHPTSVTLSPGNYTTGINANTKQTINLNPGLYCIKGGIKNNSQATIIGNSVTLYFYDSGDVQLNQNKAGDVILTSCKTEPCGDPSAIQGLLMYFDPSYQADVQLNGSSTNIFRGTVFGSNANFHLNGNTDTLSEEIYNFSTQIIGNWIEINGNAMLVMNLKSDDFVSSPPSLSLVK